jgi:uncharacterized membrane protein
MTPLESSATTERSLPSTHDETDSARAARRGRALDVTFRISIILKGLDGAFELIAGVVLLFLSPSALQGIARVVFQQELSENPHAFVATSVLHLTSGLSTSATLFGAVYLLLHGLVKVLLVWAVLKEKLWAFPWMIVFLLAFIAYQGFEMTQHFTIGLLLLTVFDLFVTWLTVLEYRKRRRVRHARLRSEEISAD